MAQPQNKVIPLHHQWVFYFEKTSSSVQSLKASDKSFSKCKPLGSFDTVQGFWGYWNNIHINKLPVNSQLRLFKSSITTSVDDPANVCGGKLVILFGKCENISQNWLICLLTMIGEQFGDGDIICGSVLSLGATKNTISLWIKTNDKNSVEEIQNDLCRFLRIASRDKIRFHRHVDIEKKCCKSFSIKLSRSVDMNQSCDSLQQTPSLSNPTVLISHPYDCDDYSTPFIDLTMDFSEQGCDESETVLNNMCRSVPTDLFGLSNRHRKSLSEEGLSFNKGETKENEPNLNCPQRSTARLHSSIDAASFRRWQTMEIAKPVYQLPKLYRRRGRKTDRSPTPRRRRTLAPPCFVPPTIPENKVFQIEVIPVIPPVKREESDKCLGIRISYWLAFFGLVATLLVGTYLYGTFFLGQDEVMAM